MKRKFCNVLVVRLLTDAHPHVCLDLGHKHTGGTSRFQVMQSQTSASGAAISLIPRPGNPPSIAQGWWHQYRQTGEVPSQGSCEWHTPGGGLCDDLKAEMAKRQPPGWIWYADNLSAFPERRVCPWAHYKWQGMGRWRRDCKPGAIPSHMKCHVNTAAVVWVLNTWELNVTRKHCFFCTKKTTGQHEVHQTGLCWSLWNKTLLLSEWEVLKTQSTGQWQAVWQTHISLLQCLPPPYPSLAGTQFLSNHHRLCQWNIQGTT